MADSFTQQRPTQTEILPAAEVQNGSDKQEGRKSCAEDVTQELDLVTSPEVPDGFVERIAKELYGFEVTTCKQLNGSVDKNYHICVTPTSSNPHVTSVCPEGYVMRVMNSHDTKRPDVLHCQVKLMHHLRSHGITTQQPVSSIHGHNVVFYNFPSCNGKGDIKKHAVFLRTFIPGAILYDVTLTHDLCFKVGAFVASMTKALEDFYHPFYDTFDLIWSMNNIPRVTEFAHVITDVRDRRLVDDVIQQFRDKVLAKRSELRSGYIHGDPTDQNILVQRQTSSEGSDASDDYVISGILDFHEMTDTHPLYDLAMAIVYPMTMPTITFDPLEVGGHVLAGYTSRMALPEVERSLVRVCVAGRLVQSLVLGVYNYSLDPGNEYLLMTGQRGWHVLHALWDTPAQEVEGLWDQIQRSYISDGE